MDAEIRAEKEAFVTNLSGCQLLHLLACALFTPFLLLLLKCWYFSNPNVVNYSNSSGSNSGNNSSSNKKKSLGTECSSSCRKSSNVGRVLLMEFAMVVIPSLLSVTLFAPYQIVNMYAVVICIVGIYLCMRKVTFEIAEDAVECARGASERKPYISTLKGANVLLTCICILAVDFQVFPRVFAKTEYFGVSLMDVGVGLFIMTSAISSSFARKYFPAIDAVTPSEAELSGPVCFSSYSAAQRVLVLLLGIGRMIALKVLNYQEKSSEYGTHWNFFVTLFFVWVIVDGIHNVLKLSTRAITYLSILVLASYQFALIKLNLTDLIFYAPRDTGFWFANREGICSLLGFVPLYLLTEVLSAHFVFRHSEPNNGAFLFFGDIKRKKTAAMMYCSALLGSVWFISDALIQKTSRRLTNCSYVLLTLAIGWTALSLFRIVDLVRFSVSPVSKLSHQRQVTSPPTAESEDQNVVSLMSSSSSMILELLSAWQLPVFLVSNLLTGLINFVFYTHRMSALGSMAILTSYSAVVVFGAWSINFFFRKV
jgi:phosphatidylinositol glycan class W